MTSEASKIARFIAALRGSHPDMQDVFMFGRCYSLFEVMRAVWPQARAHYSRTECHVYVEIGGAFFDIRGRRYKLPDDLDILDHQSGEKPHRWAVRDRRRINTGAPKDNAQSA